MNLDIFLGFETVVIEYINSDTKKYPCTGYKRYLQKKIIPHFNSYLVLNF